MFVCLHLWLQLLSRCHSTTVAARFLLKPAHKCEDAVKAFQPYDKLAEVNDDARTAAAALLAEGLRYEPRRKTYIYINNRLEGNALQTIQGILKMLEAAESLGSQESGRCGRWSKLILGFNFAGECQSIPLSFSLLKSLSAQKQRKSSRSSTVG